MARPSGVIVALASILLSACTSSASPTPNASPTMIETATAAPSITVTAVPTATPEPALSLPLPQKSDPRTIAFTVKGQADLTATTSGHLVVAVTNLSSSVVSEIVLRWPTALRETIFLAPFTPSDVRIREGGPALYQEWTKWVEGPGERGEPAGTTSLGWGPLPPGATITISLIANRVAALPVGFDLQFLAGEAILTTAAGEPAEIRVELP